MNFVTNLLAIVSLIKTEVETFLGEKAKIIPCIFRLHFFIPYVFHYVTLDSLHSLEFIQFWLRKHKRTETQEGIGICD